MTDHTPAQDRTLRAEQGESGTSDAGKDQGARQARYAEAMYARAILPNRHTDERVIAVMAVADAEVAAAMSEAQAETERLRGEVAHWKHHAWEAGEGFKRAIEDAVRAHGYKRAAQTEVERLREGIRALADEWEAAATASPDQPGVSGKVTIQMREASQDVRALLAPSPAATTGDLEVGADAPSPRPAPVSSDSTDIPTSDAEPTFEGEDSRIIAPVSSGEAGTGEAGSQWEQMLRDPNEQFDVNGEVAQVILDATGYKPHRLLGGPYAGIQHEAWLAGECGNTIEEPVQVTTASAKPSKPTTWIADLCGLPKGHDGDCVKRGDLAAPVATPSAEGSAS